MRYIRESADKAIYDELVAIRKILAELLKKLKSVIRT